MGWISTPMERPRYKIDRIFRVMDEFTRGWTPDKRPDVIDYYEKRGALYLKMRSESGLWVAIIQYEFADGQLFYRVDDNTVGSTRTDCPARILEGVPIHGPHDAQWRAQCAANRKAKKGRQKQKEFAL